jgi:hypothetical protein
MLSSVEDGRNPLRAATVGWQHRQQLTLPDGRGRSGHNYSNYFE